MNPDNQGANVKSVVVIDDLRTFKFDAKYARTSREALAMLQTELRIDELWLDHDLGGDDTVMPVVNWLERRAFYGKPFPVNTIYIHSQNPVGTARIMQALRRHYNVRRVFLSTV